MANKPSKFVTTTAIVALCFATASLLFSIHTLAVDIVRFEKGQSKLDLRILFKQELLTEALLHTLDSHGPYELQLSANPMSVSRAIKQLASGNGLNVYFAITSPSWETQTIPIRIPVRRGLLSYRLLLIKKSDQEKFRGITNATELKKLTIGLQSGWATTEILKAAEFPMVLGSNYNSMFYMLAGGRFDYLPRGVNEIFDEFDQRLDTMKGLMIEPTLALHIPSPTYIFVSPHAPKIAERLQAGLEMMRENGTLDRIFKKYYTEDIKRANLDKRTIIHIENPYITLDKEHDRNDLWYRPGEH